MFAPSFGRVVRSTSCISAVSASSLRRAAFNTAQQPFRPLHQRRLSSSKPSVPPSNKKKPAEEIEQNAATQLKGAEAVTKADGKQADAKLDSKRPEISDATSTNNVPRVSPTTHRDADDVKLSAFFALDRPISKHRDDWQHTATMDAFDAVFLREKHTQKILHEYLGSLDATIDAAEEEREARLYFEAAPTEESIKRHASMLPYFAPPPPPVAFDPFAPQPGLFVAFSPPPPPQAQHFDIFSGPHTNEALNAFTQHQMDRFTEVAVSSNQRTGRSDATRDHVRRRRGGMFLISVKRQRKLKMKKHKYKKLMKRTRLLRRKLDRT